MSCKRPFSAEITEVHQNLSALQAQNQTVTHQQRVLDKSLIDALLPTLLALPEEQTPRSQPYVILKITLTILKNSITTGKGLINDMQSIAVYKNALLKPLYRLKTSLARSAAGIKAALLKGELSTAWSQPFGAINRVFVSQKHLIFT
jgi:hypothetical protein